MTMPICPCCGDETLSAQQIRRHLAARRRRLAAALDAMNMEDDDAGPAPHDAGPAPHDAGPALDNGHLAPRGESPAPNEIERSLRDIRQRGIDLAALVAREDEEFGRCMIAQLLTVNLPTPFPS
jgi:hypothetical protein